MISQQQVEICVMFTAGPEFQTSWLKWWQQVRACAGNSWRSEKLWEIPQRILFILYTSSQDTINVTYPISAPPQTREQIAPGTLLSSKTLEIILKSKTKKFQRFLTGACNMEWTIKTVWPCTWRRYRFLKISSLAVKWHVVCTIHNTFLS